MENERLSPHIQQSLPRTAAQMPVLGHSARALRFRGKLGPLPCLDFLSTEPAPASLRAWNAQGERETGRPDARSHPSAGCLVLVRGHQREGRRSRESLNSGWQDRWGRPERLGPGGNGVGVGVEGMGMGGGPRCRVVVGEPGPASAAVAPELPAEAPTPGWLLTRWEVLEPPNFLLFNEPRRRGFPEGVCSLKM